MGIEQVQIPENRADEFEKLTETMSREQAIRAMRLDRDIEPPALSPVPSIASPATDMPGGERKARSRQGLGGRQRLSADEPPPGVLDARRIGTEKYIPPEDIERDIYEAGRRVVGEEVDYDPPKSQ